MSRVEQALRRASRSAETDALVDPRKQVDDAALQRFPRENGARPADAPDPSSLRTTPTRPRRLADLDRGFDRKLVVNDKTDPVAIEQYRRLTAALQELRLERRLKALLITSALPAEGKTLTAANLALTLGEWRAQRVLLIDADVRQPSIHRLFHIPNKTGLSHVLQSEGGDVPLSHVSANLSILTAGHPDSNMAAQLTSDRMQDLVDQFTGQFDWVLVDAPAVGVIPDAHLLARITGAVLFVIRAESTPYADVERAVRALGPDFVVGTVLNRVADRCISNGAASRPASSAMSGVPAFAYAADKEKS
jgi:capsular exopolysaccharide synthesis family protein